MSRTKALPDDVRQTCIQLVRGYDRRVREYYDRRREIIEGTPSHEDGAPQSHNASRAGENKAMQLLGLEELPETKRMRAVEQAKLQIGLDLPETLRGKLVDAIILNCKSGRRYPYEHLDIDGVARTDFYVRRTRFLVDIAKHLSLV